MKEKNTNKGITLIALIITIILMLILASITVNVVINGGLFEYAGNAKESTEIASEKETVQKAIIIAESKSKTGRVTVQEMQKAINNVADENTATAINNGDTIVVKFNESNRYYEIDNKGKVEVYKLIFDENPGNITVGINGETLTGSEEKPYEIWSIEDLVEWSNNYSKYQTAYIKLGRTLNFNSNLSYVDGKMLNCNSIEELKKLLTDTTGNGFTPIAQFSGDFDGQNFEIQNIYVNSAGDAGLFANAIGIIHNLGVSGNIMSNEGSAGGIVGGAFGGNLDLRIYNCYFEGNVFALNNAGGILGYQSVCHVGIINSYNDGTIQGKTSGRNIRSIVRWKHGYI